MNCFSTWITSLILLHLSCTSLIFHVDCQIQIDHTNTNKLIKTMEGMSFETPKGKMTFRKEDHQAMQSMYHFKIKVDPAFAWGVPELVREIKPEEMNVPIRNQR